MRSSNISSLLVCATAVAAFAVAALAESPAQIFPSAEDVEPLKVGDSIPSVMVKTLEGESIDVRDLATRQATVTIFYRGGWCPYCNTHLKELKEAMDGLEGLGYQVLAISADVPEKLMETKEKEELPYVLLSDSSMDAAAAFGIAFQLDAATVEKYKGYGLDLSASEWRLPVPSVFVNRADGVITYVHADPNYKKRLSAAGVFDAAKAAVEEGDDGGE